MPARTTSNPDIAFSASVLSIVNSTGLIINITSSLTVAAITLLLTARVSRTVLLCICVMPEPASCGPISTKSVPLYEYNCSLVVSHQKSPVAKPAGAVALISAPPVVRHLVPSLNFNLLFAVSNQT